MTPPGYTCLADVEPLTIEIQRSGDGLWTMHLFDWRGGFKVMMPPSEFGLTAAKEKALVSAAHYMRKYAGDRSWHQPDSVSWREFTPRNVQTVEDRIKQVFGVKIKLDNKEDALRAGMSADIFFPDVK